MPESFDYHNGVLHSDSVSMQTISESCSTPTYIYSQQRISDNLARIQSAFAHIPHHIHYSAKANANVHILKHIIAAGTGIDCVSGGEIFLAMKAGCDPQNIVFAGVGKTRDELRYAIENNVGWINVENAEEVTHINTIAQSLNQSVRVALRLNPEVTANTHPYIATGHGGAKFGLTAETITHILGHADDYPHINFSGIHVHIGSQLQDTTATQQALKATLDVIAPFPTIRTINIGGGLPVAYKKEETIPDLHTFASAIQPLLNGYEVILEPGRSIIADAGILLTEILYIKQQAGKTFYIVDASMTELIRPALYQAHHEIIPVNEVSNPDDYTPVTVVGPVCETADVLRREVSLPKLNPGDLLAILTTGAYGMVMASNYNARPRPAEILVNGESWHTIRQREKWAMLTD